MLHKRNSTQLDSRELDAAHPPKTVNVGLIFFPYEGKRLRSCYQVEYGNAVLQQFQKTELTGETIRDFGSRELKIRIGFGLGSPEDD